MRCRTDIYSKYYPFYHWGAYHFVECFSGAGTVCLPYRSLKEMLLVAGILDGQLSRQFFSS